MAGLTSAIRTFIATSPLAHVVTLGADGAPQVSVAWVGIEGDELVIGTLHDQAKLENLRRDSRIAMSFAVPGRNEYGLDRYLVPRGVARITEGGAASLLHDLAQTYIGPGTSFPPMPDPPAGFVIRMTAQQISGNGDWR